MDGAFARDFRCEAAAQPPVLHRRAGARDVYFVYGAEKGTECTFRAAGKVEVWDPWSGKAAPLRVPRQAEGTTRLRMPLEKTEAQLIVFSPGEAARAEGKEGAPVPVAALRLGANRLLLRYDKAGRGHFLLVDAGAAADWKQTEPLASPFRVELTGLVKEGVNRVEVLVYSALAGQYQTVPTRYRGHGPSGLIGPVRLVADGGR